MILSHRFRFIFLCNGKTGTTSIEHVLHPLDEGRRYSFHAVGLFTAKHIPAPILRGCLPSDIWSHYFKFVFVRNPYDWFVSQWRHNFKARDPGVRYAVPWIGRSPHGDLLYMGRPADELAGREIFSAEDVDLLFEFLATYHRTVPYATGCFQSSHVYDADGQEVVDYVGRYEALAEDFEKVQARIGLRVELPYLNRSVRRHYRSHFTEASAQRVAALWAQDFELLRYPLDISV